MILYRGAEDMGLSLFLRVPVLCLLRNVNPS